MKAIHQEALVFYMFHCLNISKHTSIQVLGFYSFCLMFCVLFAGFLTKIAPGVGFCTFLVPGGGEFTLSNISPRVCLGGHAWN